MEIVSETKARSRRLGEGKIQAETMGKRVAGPYPRRCYFRKGRLEEGAWKGEGGG